MRDIDVIDTQVVSPGERLDYWNSNAGDKVAPVAVRTVGGQQFDASLATRRLRDISLVSLKATPSCIHTRANDAQTGMAHLAICRSGTVLSETAGVQVRLEAGDFALYDHGKSMDVVYPQGVDLLVLRMKIADLQLRLPMLRHLIGRKVPGARGGGAVLARFLTGLWDQLLVDDEEDLDDEIEAVIWSMIQLAFSPASREIARQTPDLADHRDRLLGIIEAQLCDANLRTATIARQLQMSPRTIQLAFARMGVTPASFIRNRRLELAAAKLASAGHGRSITDVCFEVGFNDLSAFCRNFRHKFGVSPREFRKGLRPSH